MNYDVLNEVVAKPLRKEEPAPLAVVYPDNWVHPEEFTLTGHSKDNVLAKLQDKVIDVLKTFKHSSDETLVSDAFPVIVTYRDDKDHPSLLESPREVEGGVFTGVYSITCIL